MYNIKTPKGTVKKGIAQFYSTTQLTGTGAVGNFLNAFENVKKNNSSNIIKIDSNTVKLKYGAKYKLSFKGKASAFSNSAGGYAWFSVYNSTDSLEESPNRGIFSSTDYTGGFSSSCSLDVVLEPTKDTEYKIRIESSAGTLNIFGIDCIVEELEAYLIPVDPTKYTKTINFTGATGTGSSGIVIPSGLPVGTKYLCRKVNATQGTVSINTQGSEKITPALLATVTLNSDGDFWLLEKVSATRWDIIDGMETGTNSNGSWRCYANGKLELYFDYSSSIAVSPFMGYYAGTTTINTPRTVAKFASASGFAGRSADQTSTGMVDNVRMDSGTTVSFRYRTISSSVTLTNIKLYMNAYWF